MKFLFEYRNILHLKSRFEVHLSHNSLKRFQVGVMSSSTPSHSERINAVLACLRRETTYEAIAERFSVSPSDVQRWESSFIAGGSVALDPNTNRDLVSEMGAINAISQSLTAILNPNELWSAAIDNLFWV